MSLNTLIKTLASESGVTKSEAKRQIKSVFNAVSKDLENEGRVVIENFGVFKKEEKAIKMFGEMKDAVKVSFKKSANIFKK